MRAVTMSDHSIVPTGVPSLLLSTALFIISKIPMIHPSWQAVAATAAVLNCVIAFIVNLPKMIDSYYKLKARFSRKKK
jgi:hypothetical protein